MSETPNEIARGIVAGAVGWWLLIGGVLGLLWLIHEVRHVPEEERLTWYWYPSLVAMIALAWPWLIVSEGRVLFWRRDPAARVRLGACPICTHMLRDHGPISGRCQVAGCSCTLASPDPTP